MVFEQLGSECLVTILLPHHIAYPLVFAEKNFPAVYFLITDHIIFSREYSFIHLQKLLINHSYTHDHYLKIESENS